MPTISVILPAYNAEKYIEEAISSVLGQTYSDFELIIIDDGSRDNTLSIIKSLQVKDGRIKVISRENKGLVCSLNEGIALASGKYIARMDADDICYSTRFEKQVALLEERPELYLVGTKFELLYENDVDINLQEEMQIFHRNAHEEIDYENNMESILEGYKILHPTWMFRRELIDKIGMYRMYASEDNEFLFRAAVNGYHMGRVEEVLLKYRVSGSSITGAGKKQRIQKKSCIEFKLDYLEKSILNKLSNMKYVIWGASVSGELAYEVLKERYANSSVVAFIDAFKSGTHCGIPVYTPEECFANCDFDYVFICTRGGAKVAVKYLEENKWSREEDYFKII